MTHFCDKFSGLNFTKKLYHINSAKFFGKFRHKFSSKLNPISEKSVLNFKFNAFFPVNLNEHYIFIKSFSNPVDIN